MAKVQKVSTKAFKEEAVRRQLVGECRHGVVLRLSHRGMCRQHRLCLSPGSTRSDLHVPGGVFQSYSSPLDAGIGEST